jgi:predicted ATPase with chaperone activity
MGVGVDTRTAGPPPRRRVGGTRDIGAMSMVATSFHPPAPLTLEQTGLNSDAMQQLVLKTLYFGGELVGTEIAKRLGVGFGVFEPAIEFLKQQRWCEIIGGSVFGASSYRYRITDGGRGRAKLALEQNQYVGTAPVPLAQYQQYMKDFKANSPLKASREEVRQAFSKIVVKDAIIDTVGPAVNAGHSMFIYGSAGNGKTMTAQAIRNLLVNEIAIPHALEVEGYIVKVFDPVNHEEIPFPDEEESLTVGPNVDRRWARCKRPLVMVGGELTMDALELRYNATSGFYKAPVQMLANGGILVIDDFGRQQCSPKDLLNRWIVPLESRIDFLTLQSGQIFEMPFMVFLVLATNLKPTELADEAFLRRIQYKIFAEGPDRQAFGRIFEGVCKSKDIPFDQAVVDHMLDTYYRPNKVPLRGCQPRDLINQALSMAKYLQAPNVLTNELMEAACKSYFVQDRELPATYA